MGYSDKPKHFHLTPSRKKIGRILGRGNKGSLAATVLDPKNNVLQGKVIKCVTKVVAELTGKSAVFKSLQDANTMHLRLSVAVCWTISTRRTC